MTLYNKYGANHPKVTITANPDPRRQDLTNHQSVQPDNGQGEQGRVSLLAQKINRFRRDYAKV